MSIAFRAFESALTPPEAIMLDRIVGKVLADIDEEKIKRFVETTRTDRTHVFWVILGFKKTGGAAEVSERRRFLLDSFEKNGRIGHDVRVTFVDVEADEDFIEFWKTTANARPHILDK